MNIELQNLQKRLPVNPKRLTATIRRILEILKVRHVQLSVVFVNDMRMRSLNRRFLGHDDSTDVLSFPFESPMKSSIAGEIIVCAQMAVRQAREYGTRPNEEILLYVVHGVLHLLGYDDHTSEDRQKMRRKENFVLTRLRLSR